MWQNPTCRHSSIRLKECSASGGVNRPPNGGVAGDLAELDAHDGRLLLAHTPDDGRPALRMLATEVLATRLLTSSTRIATGLVAEHDVRTLLSPSHARRSRLGLASITTLKPYGHDPRPSISVRHATVRALPQCSCRSFVTV